MKPGTKAIHVGQRPDKETGAVIPPDTGRNYLSKCFKDEWMKEKGFL